jgi:HAD superfamily hydrolase (TIGR01509 family)
MEKGEDSMPIRAFIFDFDGLMIDSETAVATSWRELYARYGLEFPDAHWRSMVGTREHDDLLWNDLGEQTGLAFDTALLEPRRRARGFELASRLPLLPGVVEHIDAAAEAGVALAVASSSSDGWVNGHLARLGLSDRFAHVCTKELAERSKPDPGIYLVALDLLGVAAGEALAFEDTQAGVAAAKAAGLRVVAVPGSFSEKMDFSAADAVLESLAHVTPTELWERFGAG